MSNWIKGIPPKTKEHSSEEVWFALSNGEVRAGRANYFITNKLHSITVEGHDGFGVGYMARSLGCFKGVRVLGYCLIEKPDFPKEFS